MKKLICLSAFIAFLIAVILFGAEKDVHRQLFSATMAICFFILAIAFRIEEIINKQ